MFRVRTLALAALAALAACTGSTNTSSSLLTMNVKAPGTTQVTVGSKTPLTLVVWGRTIATTGDQSTTTQAKGVQVAVTLADAATGTLDKSTVTLGDDGKGEVQFTPCADCTNPNAVISASATIDSKEVKASVTIRLTSSTCPESVDCSIEACYSTGASCTTSAGTDGQCSKETKKCEAKAASNGTQELSVALRTLAGAELKFPRAPAAGDVFQIVAKLRTTADQAAVPDKAVTFKLTGTLGTVAATKDATGSDTVSVNTDSHGIATAFMKPGAEPANGHILVVVSDDLQKDTPFSIVKAGTLTFVQPDDHAFGIMGVKSSGFREQQLLTFKLLDSSGEPYAGSATVKFDIVTTGGASFAPSEANIDDKGEVAVTVYSGTTSGTLAVRATAHVGTPPADPNAPDTRPTITTTSPSLAIVGAKASGRNFAVRCKVVAVPGLVGNDCSFMRVAETVDCTAVAGDRFNNLLGAGGHATWHTEAALFGPPSSFPIADPAAEPAGQDGLGDTVNKLFTLNTRLPKDVAPLADEPKATAAASDPCVATDGSTRVYNPRDGLNTFIVTTQGEEGFYDTNGNGVYDQGEFFIDLGEPYIDANDNNKWDSDEVFIDADKDNTYDGPNGKWDADTTIWTTGHLMLTGLGLATAGETVAPNPVPAKGRASWSLRWMDENLNGPAATYTSYGVKLYGNGSVEQTSADHWADHYGSIDVKQVTLCDQSTKACRVETRIIQAVKPGDPQYGTYKAPDQGPDSADIAPSCTVSGAGGAITSVADLPVSVAASVP